MFPTTFTLLIGHEGNTTDFTGTVMVHKGTSTRRYQKDKSEKKGYYGTVRLHSTNGGM